MPATTAAASRIHGHTGVDDDDDGTGEVVAEGTSVTEPAALVGGGAVVVVVVGVDVVVEVFVAVDVDVEVFVGALVVEDVEVEVCVGAALVGALVVRDAIGVREGSVGRLSEREALGRFEPPPHAAVSTSAIARSAIEFGRIRRARLTRRCPFHLMPQHLSRVTTGSGRSPTDGRRRIHAVWVAALREGWGRRRRSIGTCERRSESCRRLLWRATGPPTGGSRLREDRFSRWSSGHGPAGRASV